jgi:hypothetical protein
MMGTMSQVSEHPSHSSRRRSIPDELGRQLLVHLAVCRPQWLSLHDSEGETLWLSGGSFGPDEHACVLQAFEVFTLEPRRMAIQRRLEDGRRALFLAARDPLGGCSGVVFAPVEVANVDERQLLSPAAKALVQRFSMLLAPPVELRPGAAAATEADPAESVTLPEGAPIHARSYTRLQQGGGTRRYEISIPPSGTSHDASVVERVTEWLAQNRQRYIARPASFTIAVSATAAIDPEFAQRVEQSLGQSEMHEGLLILLIPAAAWTEFPNRVVPLLDACERVNCHVMLDDFELKEAGLELLRHKAIRMLKLRCDLTTAAMDDRYARAMLSSCLQIARVLGIHCVAKRVQGATASRWLANAGIDYVDPATTSETGAPAASGEALALRQVS